MEALSVIAALKLYLILQCVLYILSRYLPIFKHGTLYCGIFGGSAKKGKTLNKRKLAALGLYNVQRGVDSCGYYYSGHIAKGVDEEKNFGKFIANNHIIRGDLAGEIFMGHTRKSTVGLNTAENAHPHAYNNYVQTHNGQIKNIWDLMIDCGIKTSEAPVDSMGLARIIEQEKNFSVLEKYTGYAAIASTFMDKSESLYLFHGASKEYSHSPCLEERPLFTLETPEGIYYSSLEESLDFINESTKVKPKILPHNMVYRYEYGEMVERILKIERQEANVPLVKNFPVHVPSSVPLSQRTIPFDKSSILNNGSNSRIGRSATLLALRNEKENAKEGNTSKDYSSIIRETYPADMYSQDIYYRMGRFWRKKDVLLDGVYNIDRDGKFVDAENPSIRVSSDYYFLRGIMMRSKEAYSKAIQTFNSLDLEKANIAYHLSLFSKHPICSIEGEAKLITSDMCCKWYKDQLRCTAEFKPKFSKRTYILKNGEIAGVKRAYDNEALFNDVMVNPKYTVDGEESETELTLKILRDTVRAGIKATIKTEKDIEALPEPLLIFIDYFNESYHGKEVSDNTIELETSMVLRDMMKTNQSFRDVLVEHSKLYMMGNMYVDECFKHFSFDEIASLENRYLTINFNSHFDDVEDLSSSLMPTEKYDASLNEIFGKDPALNPKKINYWKPNPGWLPANHNDIVALATRQRVLVTRLEELTKLAEKFASPETSIEVECKHTTERDICDLKEEMRLNSKKIMEYNEKF